GRRQEGHAGGGPGLSRIPLHARGAGDRGPQLLPSAPRDRGPEVRVHVPQGPARHDRRGLRRLAEGAEDALRGRRRGRRDIPAMKLRTPRHRVLPGFGLALGFTLLYLSLVVLVPLSTLFWKSAGLGWAGFGAAVTAPRVVASYKLTFGASLVAAAVNGAFGLVVTWVLVRYRFPGRAVVNALVDLPFALPTALAGLAPTTPYAPNGWLGAPL